MCDETDGGAVSRALDKDNKDEMFLGRHKIFQPEFDPHNDDSFEHIFPPDSYNMRTFPRGKLIIINIEEFSYHSGYYASPRKGTNRDCETLVNMFLDFGFIVEVFKDISTKELIKVMKRISHDHFQPISTLFMAFLTHGLEKNLYMTDGPIEIRKITDYMKGSNLAGKPKVMIIQACQGVNYMDTLETDGPSSPSKREISFPAEADFLYAYSTAYGFYSWRNGETGSWFIQALCKVFTKHAHTMDVVRMLTRVNAEVCQQVSYTNDPDTSGKKQATSTVSQLRKELYIFPPVS
ncbi:caspase-3-like [Clytia hemisphaerica]|uniref:caspase-3-like n=1 Tax=Clytia hemisphaerica TaxID=252671 RepID=UPI0034D6FF0E